MSNKQGMNWIAPQRRLAIYLRDGLACVYCRAGIASSDIRLTLDHITPRSRRGSNKTHNLVTACKACNDSRKALLINSFCFMIAKQTGESPFDVFNRVQKQRRRSILMFQHPAKVLLATHKTVTKSIKPNAQPH